MSPREGVAGHVVVGNAIAGKSRDLQTWSAPVTSYGELEGLRLPLRVKAVWKLTEGDREDIDITLTDLRYDA